MKKFKAFMGLQLVRFGLFVFTTSEGDYSTEDARRVIKLWNLRAHFERELAS